MLRFKAKTKVVADAPADPKLGMPAILVHEEDPYLRGRRLWDERWGDAIAREHSWKLAAFSAFFVAGLSVVGNIYQSSQSQIVPFVVEVDKLGEQMAVMPASVAGPVDPRVVRAQLARWIFDARTLFADIGADRQMNFELYSMLAKGSPAQAKMTDYFQAQDPLIRAQTELVSITINSVLPRAGSDKMWRLEWTEHITNRAGQPQGPAKHWQADVTIEINPPKDLKTIMVNPLGIYVTAFNWTERL